MNRSLSRVAGLLLGAATTTTWATAEPLTAWNFRVFLDDMEIGQHRFELRRAADGHKLVSEADFRVRVLFFDAYRYRHTATEHWRGNCLESLSARTDDNGDIETVQAKRTNRGFTVNATGTRGEYEGCVRSFAYWNPDILSGGRLLNAQTGEYVPVTLTPLGTETIRVRDRLAAARRYRLSGPEIEIDLWYAGDDREWVALESRAREGRRVRYEIR